MDATGAGGRSGLGAALALAFASLSLSALDAVPLVLLPLGAALIALPLPGRWRWVVLGLLLWLLGLSLPGGPLETVSRGWGSLLAGGFLLAALWRPRWGVMARSLLTVAVAFTLGAVWLAATGGWTELDEAVRARLVAVAQQASTNFQSAPEGSAWLRELGASMREMALVQWRIFPALLALQSLAALGLASWVIGRLRGSRGVFTLRPLRDFRFSDQLVWLLIGGIVLVIFPLGEAATRVGHNALFFMSSLYALRGIGIFLFLAAAAPSTLAIVLGVLVTLFLYPLVLTAALVVGLGDTWLDVRRRAAVAPPA